MQTMQTMGFMEWLNAWWGNLDLFTQVLYCVAIPATLILLLQTIMIFAGFSHVGAGINPSDTSGFDGSVGSAGSMDSDFSFDTDVSADTSGDIDTDVDMTDGSGPGDFGTMNFFTVQGVVTFLCVFGWAGIIIYGASGNIALTVITSFVLGAAAMYGVAKLIWLSKKLTHNGTLNINNLIGTSGTVYLIIPAAGAGRGKVSVTSGERLLEFDAITDGEETLTDGTRIRVIDIRSDNLLVVEKI